MESSTKNLLLTLGIIWTVTWTIIWLYVNTGGCFFEYCWSLGFFYLFYEIPGLILILIAAYNWGAGPDLKRKQETPIENESADINENSWD